VINDARTVADDVTISDWQLPAGGCVTIVAAAGAGNTLTIQFMDHDKRPLGEPLDGSQLSKLFCAQRTAMYGYTIIPAEKAPFTWEELQCEASR
jgi:hypothetical protein